MSWLDLQCRREAKAAQGDEAEPRQMTPEAVAVNRLQLRGLDTLGVGCRCFARRKKFWQRCLFSLR